MSFEWEWEECEGTKMVADVVLRGGNRSGLDMAALGQLVKKGVGGREKRKVGDETVDIVGDKYL